MRVVNPASLHLGSRSRLSVFLGVLEDEQGYRIVTVDIRSSRDHVVLPLHVEHTSQHHKQKL